MRRHDGRLWLALAFIVVGVPAVACGGRVLDGSRGPGDDVGPAGTGASDQSPKGDRGSSSPGSPAAFGPFPCTSYTAAYESCPPSTTSGGCPYYADPGGWPGGVLRTPNATVSPGCRLEIVPPTSPGGVTCEHIDCDCTVAGAWAPASGTPTSRASFCDLRP